MTHVAGLDASALEQLRQGFHGQIIERGDAGYDQTRGIWNGAFDRRPALIARASGTADVVAAVEFARENGLLLAVRGGGHSLPGYSACDDGLVLDLRLMNGVFVDRERKIARAQGGALWGDLDRETQAYGLGVTGGQITHTGIAGLTLGGGIGWLGRKFGLTCDNLVSAEVVTADGSILTASEGENSDLFWGLRGGGGNFGVVTSFEYRLHEVGPLILGGAVLHPADRAPEVLRFFREFTADAPDEVTTYAIFFTAPPHPPFPEHVQGQGLLALAACYAGDLAEGEEVVKPLREFGPPVMDILQPMPYTVIQSMFDESSPIGRPYYVRGDNVGTLSDELIDVIVEHANNIPRPFAELHVGSLGGAISRMPEDATPYGGRDAQYALIYLAGWEDPAEKDERVAWVRAVSEAARPHVVGVYVNFLENEGDERIRFAYGSPEKYERLAALKAKYDPGNLFLLNQNIKPAA
jgi:FAD/FMN-containing dehydrogenase